MRCAFCLPLHLSFRLTEPANTMSTCCAAFLAACLPNAHAECARRRCRFGEDASGDERALRMKLQRFCRRNGVRDNVALFKAITRYD